MTITPDLNRFEAFYNKLTPAQREKYQRDMERDYARDTKSGRADAAPMSFSDFKRKFWRAYKPAPYDDAIDAILQGIADYVLSDGERGFAKAMLFLPPRSGKTMRLRLFCAWLITQKPELQIITASYGARLAEKTSRWIRNLLQRRDFMEAFPHVKLLGAASDQWETSEGGGLLSAGVGGSITGFGALLGIIDDPMRGRADAESDLIRDRIKDWYHDDYDTRIEQPGGAQVICSTRWHTDDLCGALLAADEDEYEDSQDKWHVLSLPAIAIENDAIGRAPGEALWPARYPIEWLNRKRAKMGDYSFNSQYQQSPIQAAGNIFKLEWFLPPLDRAPTIVQKVRAWDLAMSEKTSADETASVLMGIGEDGHYYILDVTHKRVDWGNLVQYIAVIILADGENVTQGIERKGYMSRAIQELNLDNRLHGFQVTGFDVDSDKLTRALPFAAKCGAGLVHVLSRYWTEAFTDQICGYPFMPHDDIFDAASGCYNLLISNDASAIMEGGLFFDDHVYLSDGANYG